MHETADAVEMRAALLRLRRATGLPVAFGGLLHDARRLRIADQALRESLLSVCGRLATAAGGPPSEHTVALTPREVDVLACVAAGSTKAVADERLGLKPETVKGYLRSAMRKLGAHPAGGGGDGAASGAAAVGLIGGNRCRAHRSGRRRGEASAALEGRPGHSVE